MSRLGGEGGDVAMRFEKMRKSDVVGIGVAVKIHDLKRGRDVRRGDLGRQGNVRTYPWTFCSYNVVLETRCRDIVRAGEPQP